MSIAIMVYMVNNNNNCQLFRVSFSSLQQIQEEDEYDEDTEDDTDDADTVVEYSDTDRTGDSDTDTRSNTEFDSR